MGKPVTLTSEDYDLVVEYAKVNEVSYQVALSRLLHKQSTNTPTQTTEKVVEKQTTVVICPKCKQVFKEEHAFTRHAKESHSVDFWRTYWCMFCNEDFMNLDDFLKHKQDRHTSEIEKEQARRIAEASKANTQGMIKSGYLDKTPHPTEVLSTTAGSITVSDALKCRNWDKGCRYQAKDVNQIDDHERTCGYEGAN